MASDSSQFGRGVSGSISQVNAYLNDFGRVLNSTTPAMKGIGNLSPDVNHFGKSLQRIAGITQVLARELTLMNRQYGMADREMVVFAKAAKNSGASLTEIQSNTQNFTGTIREASSATNRNQIATEQLNNGINNLSKSVDPLIERMANFTTIISNAESSIKALGVAAAIVATGMAVHQAKGGANSAIDTIFKMLPDSVEQAVAAFYRLNKEVTSAAARAAIDSPGKIKASAASALPPLMHVLTAPFHDAADKFTISAAQVLAGKTIGGTLGGAMAHAGEPYAVSGAFGVLGDEMGGRKGRNVARAGRVIQGGMQIAEGGLSNIMGGLMGSGWWGKTLIGAGLAKTAIHSPMMAPALAGGATGAATNVTSKLVGMEFEKFAHITDLLNPHLERMNRLTGPMSKGFENFGSTVGKLATPMGAMGGIIGTVGGAFTGLHTQLAQMIGPIMQFVALFDPGAVEQLQIVMNDLQATIGEILKPIIVGLTPIIRKFADMMATMNPVFQEVIGPLMDIVGIFADLLPAQMKVLVPQVSTFGLILKELTPIIKVLAQMFAASMSILAPAFTIIGIIVGSLEPLLAIFEHALHAVASAVEYVAHFITETMNWTIKQLNGMLDSTLGKTLGFRKITTFDDLHSRSSTGKAVGKSEYIGLEEMAKKTNLAALDSQSGKGLTPDGVAVTEALNKIYNEIAKTGFSRQQGGFGFGNRSFMDLEKDGQ